MCLGAIAFNAVMGTLKTLGLEVQRPRPPFTHGAEFSIGTTVVLGCYHVRQQNTFTGRLTPAMIDTVLQRARKLAGKGR